MGMSSRCLNEGALRRDRRGGTFSTPRSNRAFFAAKEHVSGPAPGTYALKDVCARHRLRVGNLCFAGCLRRKCSLSNVHAAPEQAAVHSAGDDQDRTTSAFRSPAIHRNRGNIFVGEVFGEQIWVA